MATLAADLTVPAGSMERRRVEGGRPGIASPSRASGTPDGASSLFRGGPWPGRPRLPFRP